MIITFTGISNNPLRLDTLIQDFLEFCLIDRRPTSEQPTKPPLRTRAPRCPMPPGPALRRSGRRRTATATRNHRRAA